MSAVPFLIIMWIYAIQLVCFWCGCCRCLRKCCPAKCLQCVFSTCRLPCGIVSRFLIEALVFGFNRLFSKKKLADTDATYLLFLKKLVAFIDGLNPLLKPASGYNTRSDGCCCFCLVTVFFTLLFLIVGTAINVFAKNFPVTVSDNCTLYDENMYNNFLYILLLSQCHILRCSSRLCFCKYFQHKGEMLCSHFRIRESKW